MSITIIERELPGSDEKGLLFDIYRVLYKFDINKDKSITKLPRSEKYIRGFVSDKNMPKEGNTFRMTHHMLSGKAKFGLLKLNNCSNVIEEEDSIYFEIDENRYILIPVAIN